MVGQRQTNFSATDLREEHWKFLSCFVRYVSSNILKITLGLIHLIRSGASGIYGPYQDVQRLFAQIDEARLVDPSMQDYMHSNSLN
jgi:hypothetical protein